MLTPFEVNACSARNRFPFLTTLLLWPLYRLQLRDLSIGTLTFSEVAHEFSVHSKYRVVWVIKIESYFKIRSTVSQDSPTNYSNPVSERLKAWASLHGSKAMFYQNGIIKNVWQYFNPSSQEFHHTFLTCL